ncbi:MAG: SMC family ATPase [Cyanobacteria bacterium P01_F01_bin.150]
MEILSVTLKNFKAHSDRHVQFQPGTNAICGENGAGKTSILEAIAWTLFNYRGNYRKEDFIRNGCRSAQATISFVSNRDQRTYNVQRCTSKGYTIFDPQLSQRLPYSRIDDEVLPWLRDHLGVTAGTDLPRLFENTIGVPQGMLTADFLLSGEKRRRVFDSILKVEEYKQTATGLGALQKYADGQIDGVERDLAHYEEILSDRPHVESKHAELAKQIQSSELQLASSEQQLTELKEQKEQWDLKAKTVNDLEQQLRTVTTQLEGRQREQTLWADAVERSQQAVQLCEHHRPGHEQYLAAEDCLKVLQQKRHAHTQLLQQQQRLEQQGMAVERELAALDERLRQVTTAEERIKSLTPFLEQQEQLEQQKQALDAALIQQQQWHAEKKAMDKQLQRLRADWKDLSQEIKRIKGYETEAATIPALEQRRNRLQAQISRVEVAKQFETELQDIAGQIETESGRHYQNMQGVIAQLQQLRSVVSKPNQAVLDSVLTTLGAGDPLNEAIAQRLGQILADVSSQASIVDLQSEQQMLSQQIQDLYQKRVQWETLTERQAKLAAIQQEGTQAQHQIDQLVEQLEAQGDLQSTLADVKKQLQHLGDPRQQQQLLQRELAKKPSLLKQQDQWQQQQQDRQTALEQLRQQLQEFSDIDLQIQQQQQQQQTHHASYLAVLQHQQGADQLGQNQSALAQIKGAIADLAEQKKTLTTQHQTAVERFNRSEAQNIDALYQQVRSQADQILGGLPQQKLQLTELAERIDQFKDIAEKRDIAAADCIHKKDVQEFIAFARNVYKQAGPRITERYVQAISAEADRLFRELLNRQNVALQWTRDYEIIVQEGPHPRRFVNLSGGEQMCAALAVRLALLRVLADIDVAFFDEPTTNMDRARRESLAEAISNLRTFRQLFVISHDDTFEQFTEHVILIKREP